MLTVSELSAAHKVEQKPMAWCADTQQLHSNFKSVIQQSSNSKFRNIRFAAKHVIKIYVQFTSNEGLKEASVAI